MVRWVFVHQRGVSCLGGRPAARVLLKNKKRDLWSERRWKIRESPNCRGEKSDDVPLAGGQQRDNLTIYQRVGEVLEAVRTLAFRLLLLIS